MPKTNQKLPDRKTLIKRFRWLISKLGANGEEFAYNVVEELYPKADRRTRNLTLYQFNRVIETLQQRSGIKFDSAYQKRQKKEAGKAGKEPVTFDGYEVASPAQHQLIFDHAAKLKMSSRCFVGMVLKFFPEWNPMPEPAARKLIQALKSMNQRGWKESKTEHENIPVVKQARKKTEPVVRKRAPDVIMDVNGEIKEFTGPIYGGIDDVWVIPKSRFPKSDN